MPTAPVVSPVPAPAGAVHLAAAALLLVLPLMALHIMARARRGEAGLPLRTCVFLILAAVCAGLGAGVLTLRGGSAGLKLSDWAFAETAGAGLSLFSPVSAVAFFAANLFLRPWELVPENTFFAALPRSLAALCAITWLAHGIIRRRLEIAWNLPIALFALFCLWLAYATFGAENVEHGWPYLSSLFVPVAVLVFLVVNAVRDEDDLRLLTGVLSLSAGGMIAAALAAGSLDAAMARLEGTGLMGNPNDLAAVVVLALPFTTAFFLRRPRGGIRILIGLSLIGVLLTGLWYSQSRGAKLGVAVMCAVYIFFGARFSARKFLLAAVLAAALSPLLLKTSRKSEDLSLSTANRLSYAVAAWRMAEAYPFFGAGAGRYPFLYDRYSPGSTETGPRTAHSTWLLALAETGFVGLFLLAAIYLSVLHQAWRLRRLRPEFLSAVIGYGIAMTFLSHTYLFLPYLLFAMVVAAHRVYSPNV